MKRIIRVITTTLTALSESYDAVFYTSGCAGDNLCTCAPYDHSDEDITTFEPAGVVGSWIRENEYPIAYEDDRLIYLTSLTDAQRQIFQNVWGI